MDGIYLFGNDSVLNYYPKFGFVPCEEYDYYFSYVKENGMLPYSLEKVDMSDSGQAKKVYAVLEKYVTELKAQNEKLYIYQIIGKHRVEPARVAKAFEGEFSEVVLGYTPVHKEGLSVRKHKEKDCTLFIMGEDLKCVSEKQMMFPILSHA